MTEQLYFGQFLDLKKTCIIDGSCINEIKTVYPNYYWFFKPFKFKTVCRCILLSGSSRHKDWRFLVPKAMTRIWFLIFLKMKRKIFGLVISSVYRKTFVLLFKFKYMRICYVIKNSFSFVLSISLLCTKVDIISALLHTFVLLSPRPILLLIVQCTIPILW